MKRRIALGLALGIILVGPNAEAQMTQATLAELVAEAGTIIAGRVVEVREGRHPQYHNIVVTFVTLEVAEMFKATGPTRLNPPGPSRLTFMQFGNPRTLPVHDLPHYRPGEEVVLFLYPESQYGFTSPVAGGQGKFIIERDRQTGARQVVNGINNWNLLRGLDSEHLSLSRTERAAAAQMRGAISYEVFASLVRKLVGSMTGKESSIR
ncbi:MAG TPA: hypothetical protein VNM72_10215 [Blastocatellia bacterium]|nr:hypothetical protein [Blastocatellia bacterium]